MSKPYQTTARLPDELGRQLEAVAEHTGRKVSEVIRQALHEHVGERCSRCNGSGYEPGPG